jgi:CHAD domain-containing protein
MAFRLRPKESVRRGLRRLAHKELKRAAASLNGPGPRKNDEAVHEARRSVKKVRAIVTVLEVDHAQGLKKRRKRLRDVSRALSKLRDMDARIKTFDRLRRRAPSAVSTSTGALVRRQLVEDKERLLRDAETRKTVEHAAHVLCQSARAARRWRSRHRNFPALAAALHDARHEGRLAMNRARAHRQAENFHEWRKAVKKLWYELRLLEECGPSIRAELRALERLQRWLGEDHDVVVLCNRLLNDEPLVRACNELDGLRKAAERYQRQLRRKALALGKTVFTAPPARFVDQVERHWREWQKR